MRIIGTNRELLEGTNAIVLLPRASGELLGACWNSLRELTTGSLPCVQNRFAEHVPVFTGAQDRQVWSSTRSFGLLPQADQTHFRRFVIIIPRILNVDLHLLTLVHHL